MQIGCDDILIIKVFIALITGTLIYQDIINNSHSITRTSTENKILSTREHLLKLLSIY